MMTLQSLGCIAKSNKKFEAGKAVSHLMAQHRHGHSLPCHGSWALIECAQPTICRVGGHVRHTFHEFLMDPT